ncbi:DUF5131 family protein [Streptomyces sp. NPDC059153]|uniref:DUF5131 family protein n=1 Tax=Streptomyces sp. NPDC059153 TaxID=3346743 RepID=UPI003695B76D
MHPDEPGTKYCFFSGLDMPGTTEQKNPRTVFVNSMSDLFHAWVPLDFVRQVFEVMADTPQHTYQGRCHVGWLSGMIFGLIRLERVVRGGRVAVVQGPSVPG